MLGTVTRSTLTSSVCVCEKINSLQATFVACSPTNCSLKSSAAGIDFPADKLFHICAL